MTTGRIDLPMDVVAAYCRKWHMTELALFGSVLRDDFGPDSDIDVLVTFEPGDTWTFGEPMDMHEEPEAILGNTKLTQARRAAEPRLLAACCRAFITLLPELLKDTLKRVADPERVASRHFV